VRVVSRFREKKEMLREIKITREKKESWWVLI
jgi:hypothetical protein